MEKQIENAGKIFLEEIQNKSVRIFSHFDTDGITSAAIIAQLLKKLDKNFSVKIVKSLEKNMIKNLKIKENEVLLFLDLGSGSLEEIAELPCKVFIIDHHEITTQKGENTILINPCEKESKEGEISAAGLAYLFAKSIDCADKELANLAVIGMVGDMLDREVSKLNNKILEDAEIIIKKGLMMYPATRPVNKTLEFSSLIYIPGVTGNARGALNLLREIGIKKEHGTYKTLIELNEEELSKLITAILLRTKKSGDELIGNIYLVKIFSKLEDARELSALINACSRLGHSNIALSYCLKNKKSIKKASEIYAIYKQQIISALNYAQNNRIEGKNYIIINAQDKIKDTIIGTTASIISMSSNKQEGSIVVGMAYDMEKIKVSARVVGKNGRNVRELLANILKKYGGECGGHPFAAGCLIKKEQEQDFLKNLKKSLELEVVKI